MRPETSPVVVVADERIDRDFGLREIAGQQFVIPLDIVADEVTGQHHEVRVSMMRVHVVDGRFQSRARVQIADQPFVLEMRVGHPDDFCHVRLLRSR